MVKTGSENTVRKIELAGLGHNADVGGPLLDDSSELVNNIRVRLSVCVGNCRLTVRELLALREKSVLSLDKESMEPVDVMLDGKLVARGQLVAVDDNFGVRISEIVAA